MKNVWKISAPMTGSLLENSAVLFAKFMHNFEKYKEKKSISTWDRIKKSISTWDLIKKKYFNLRSRYCGRFMLLVPIYAPHSSLLEKKGLVCPFHQLWWTFLDFANMPFTIPSLLMKRCPPNQGFDSINAHLQSKPNLSTSPAVRILMVPNQLQLKHQQGRAPRNIKTVPPHFS